MQKFVKTDLTHGLRRCRAICYIAVPSSPSATSLNEAQEGADNTFGALRTFHLPAQTLPANYYLAISNRGTGTGATGRNAYRLANVITRNECITLSANATPGEDTVTLVPSFRFAEDATSRRVFLVSGPVSYLCNSAVNARTLRRYSNYAITAAIPIAETSAQLSGPGVVNAIVSQNLASCALRCCAGSTSPCNGALVVDMAVAEIDNAANEVVRVFAQLPVDNNP